MVKQATINYPMSPAHGGKVNPIKTPPPVMPSSSLKIESNRRLQAMFNHQNRWVPAWQDLSDLIDQTRGIFNQDYTKVGIAIDHKKLLDSHATDARRVTASGMQMGMTDPLRPWFELSIDSFNIEDYPGTKEWLDEVTRRMHYVMSNSNFYTVTQQVYDEITQFGTACFIILEDMEDVIRCRSFTTGEYVLAINSKGRVNGFGRRFEMTVQDMCDEFGFDNLSSSTQQLYTNNQRTQLIPVNHLIEENNTRIPGYQDFKNMKYRSLYWENISDDDNQFLGERGFKSFRVIAPRWDTVTTTQIYGYGPGWHALGDIKELQKTHQDLLLAQEKEHNPPTVEDANVVGHSNKLPGGITKISGNVPNSGLRPAYQVDAKIQEMQQSIEILHKKIDRRFFADIFRMISNLEGQPNVTAYQIAQMKQEQMMMLGPILHGLNTEMHSPAVDIIFEIMQDAVDDNGDSWIPEPPAGLPAGTKIKVKYISILAMAQKAMGVQQIEQTVMSIGNIEKVLPGSIDILNGQECARGIADGNGLPAKCTNDKATVEALGKQRAQQAAQQQALQSGLQMADAAAKLGKTPANGGPQSVLDVAAAAAGGAR